MNKAPSVHMRLRPERAEPELIRFLLSQSGTTQRQLAQELGTTQQRLSRVANGKAQLSEMEFERAASALALGRPSELDWRDEHARPLPSLVVTRWHASAAIEAPPVTRHGKLPVFVNFSEADLVAAYLRCFGGTGNPVVVPTWRSWLSESLAARGLGLDALQPFTAPAGEDGVALQDYVAEFDDMQRALRPAFIAAASQYWH